MKAAWYDVTPAVKMKLGFMDVTKLFQNVKKKPFSLASAVEFSPT